MKTGSKTNERWKDTKVKGKMRRNGGIGGGREES